jgi:C4-dicarboxylate-specific signal transduction histidine kinase
MEEVRLLQRCINDLVSVLALPALWAGRGPAQVLRTLADALFGMLRLDLVYARLNDVGGAPVELARVGQAHGWAARADELRARLLRALGADPRHWPESTRVTEGGTSMSVVPLRLGLKGEVGILIVGSVRLDFPLQTESLVLDVAANQAVIGLQEVQLLVEQKRIADDLDRRVAQRTAELSVAIEDLRREANERRLSEQALDGARAELARVARITTFGALTASIAHEVNQPLAGIVTNASTCLRMLGADPPNIEGACDTARRTIRDADRASDVIKRLRALFGGKGLTPERVDLNEAAQEVVALSMGELQRCQVVVRLELADDLPLVTGDRVQIQQVIMNLLLNASDAMSGVHDRARQLVVRTENEDDERVRLTVRDAGVGLDAQSVERLFEAFYTTKKGGMGIGLSISRSIIDGHRGRIFAAPNDGPGATFGFSIPRSFDDAARSPRV